MSTIVGRHRSAFEFLYRALSILLLLDFFVHISTKINVELFFIYYFDSYDNKISILNISKNKIDIMSR